jgi:hypothetical protein
VTVRAEYALECASTPGKKGTEASDEHNPKSSFRGVYPDQSNGNERICSWLHVEFWRESLAAIGRHVEFCAGQYESTYGRIYIE